MIEQGAPTIDQEKTMSQDALGMYVDAIGHEPLLDAEQEVDLAQKIETGLLIRELLENRQALSGAVGEGEGVSVDISDVMRARLELFEAVPDAELSELVRTGEEAYGQFIRSNLGLVISLAQKYRRETPLIDRIQAGNEGLMTAVMKFDYTKGYKFSTYATWWIRKRVIAVDRTAGGLVDLSEGMREKVFAYKKAKAQLAIELGVEPTPDQIAAAMGSSRSRLAEIGLLASGAVYLDQPVGASDSDTVGDLTPAQETDFYSGEVPVHEQLYRVLDSTLDGIEREVIYRLYGMQGYDQEALSLIASRLEMTMAAAQKIKRGAQAKLEAALMDMPGLLDAFGERDKLRARRSA